MSYRESVVVENKGQSSEQTLKQLASQIVLKMPMKDLEQLFNFTVINPGVQIRDDYGIGFEDYLVHTLKERNQIHYSATLKDKR